MIQTCTTCFLCCHWSIIWENIWVYRFRIDFEVSVIFFGSQCKIQGKIDAHIYFGHNFWQEGPTDLRSTPLSYIFDALFRDTPLGHVCRTQPNSQIAKLAIYRDIGISLFGPYFMKTESHFGPYFQHLRSLKVSMTVWWANGPCRLHSVSWIWRAAYRLIW